MRAFYSNDNLRNSCKEFGHTFISRVEGTTESIVLLNCGHVQTLKEGSIKNENGMNVTRKVWKNSNNPPFLEARASVIFLCTFDREYPVVSESSLKVCLCTE